MVVPSRGMRFPSAMAATTAALLAFLSLENALSLDLVESVLNQGLSLNDTNSTAEFSNISIENHTVVVPSQPHSTPLPTTPSPQPIPSPYPSPSAIHPAPSSSPSLPPFLCGPGTWGMHGTLAQRFCQDCPEGKYADGYGARKEEDCKSCSPGKFVRPFPPGRATSESLACFACPAGKYALSPRNISECFDCPKNTYGRQSRTLLESQCTPCPEGMSTCGLKGQAECVFGRHNRFLGCLLTVESSTGQLGYVRFLASLVESVTVFMAFVVVVFSALSQSRYY